MKFTTDFSIGMELAAVRLWELADMKLVEPADGLNDMMDQTIFANEVVAVMFVNDRGGPQCLIGRVADGERGWWLLGAVLAALRGTAFDDLWWRRRMAPEIISRHLDTIVEVYAEVVEASQDDGELMRAQFREMVGAIREFRTEEFRREMKRQLERKRSEETHKDRPSEE